MESVMTGSMTRRTALAALTGMVGTAVMAADKAIAIIGTGRVGGALGARLGRAGYAVIYGSRTPDDPRIRDLIARSGPSASAALPAAAAKSATLVMITTPWANTESAIKGLGDLSGKILIDTTNPFEFKDGRDVELPVKGSAAEMIQSWVPGAKVVKAFNTVNFRVMAAPEKAEGPSTIPLAGDDADAKRAVAEVVRALAPFEPFDVGPLHNAAYVEKMALLSVNVILQNRPDAFEYVLRSRKK
jgi:predicted dinucleotide-binding enzyme